MSFYSFCEDAQIKVKLQGKPVHSFFKPEYFLEYGTGTMREPTLRDQIVDMKIEDFLGLAEPIPKDDEKRHAPQEEFRKDVLSGKKTEWEIPYLIIQKNEDDIWKVVGHDGRHRAMLLKSIGYDEIPVHIMIPNGELLEQDKPDKLWCQNDKHLKRAKDYYPFPPITGENYNRPYCEVEGLRELNIMGTRGIASDEADDVKAKGWKIPDSCLNAKRNFEAGEIKDARKAAYRTDYKVPFSTYLEFVNRMGQ